MAQRLDQYILEAFERPRRHVDPSRPAVHAKEIGQDVVTVVGQKLSSQELDNWASDEKQRIASALDDGSWVRVLPGRPVLRQLAGELNVRYERLRNVAVARLKEQGIPQDIREIMEQILN